MTVERADRSAPERTMELLWGNRARPSRGPKPGLSVDQIVQAAIEVADAEGLPALSMRRVAERLGFTTMSLYRYVPGKAELGMLMMDAISGEPPALDEVDGGWRAKLAAWATANFQVIRRHPWGLQLAMVDGAPPLGPNGVAWLESALSALAGTGLSEVEKLYVVMLVSSWLRGAAQVAIGQTEAQADTGVAPEEWGTVYGQLLRGVVADGRHPALAGLVEAGVFDAPQTHPDEDFDFGLRLLLDGIEALVTARSGAKDG